MRRAPDKISDNAKCMAWRYPREDAPASLGAWLVHQPGVHPLWEYWLVNVAHLRPVEGLPDPVLHFNGATHEFAILSINPELCPLPDPDKVGELRFLSPPDLIKQLQTDDASAEKMLEQMINLVIAGRMALDSDYRGHWISLLDNTVEHMRTGCHGENPGTENDLA